MRICSGVLGWRAAGPSPTRAKGRAQDCHWCWGLHDRLKACEHCLNSPLMLCHCDHPNLVLVIPRKEGSLRALEMRNLMAASVTKIALKFQNTHTQIYNKLKAWPGIPILTILTGKSSDIPGSPGSDYYADILQPVNADGCSEGESTSGAHRKKAGEPVTMHELG